MTGPSSFHLERRETSYLFIDGGYLRRRYEEAIDSVFRIPGELDYSNIRSAFSCAKAFYYDCLDECKPAEASSDYAARRKTQEDLFNSIREIPGFHVRTGTLSGRRQKEVDVALAVDMLTHAFYKNMSRAVLIAGDLDFRPVVDSLVKLGAWAEVASARSTTAKPLQWAADQHRELTFLDLYSWSTDTFRSRHPIPNLEVGNTRWVPHGWTLARTGRFGESQALLIQNGQALMIQFIPSNQKNVNNLVFHGGFEVLERYFKAMFGEIEWKA